MNRIDSVKLYTDLCGNVIDHLRKDGNFSILTRCLEKLHKILYCAACEQLVFYPFKKVTALCTHTVCKNCACVNIPSCASCSILTGVYEYDRELELVLNGYTRMCMLIWSSTFFRFILKNHYLEHITLIDMVAEGANYSQPVSSELDRIALDRSESFVAGDVNCVMDSLLTRAKSTESSDFGVSNFATYVTEPEAFRRSERLFQSMQHHPTFENSAHAMEGIEADFQLRIPPSDDLPTEENEKTTANGENTPDDASAEDNVNVEDLRQLDSCCCNSTSEEQAVQNCFNSGCPCYLNNRGCTNSCSCVNCENPEQEAPIDDTWDERIFLCKTYLNNLSTAVKAKLMSVIADNRGQGKRKCTDERANHSNKRLPTRAFGGRMQRQEELMYEDFGSMNAYGIGTSGSNAQFYSDEAYVNPRDNISALIFTFCPRDENKRNLLDEAYHRGMSAFGNEANGNGAQFNFNPALSFQAGHLHDGETSSTLTANNDNPDLQLGCNIPATANAEIVAEAPFQGSAPQLNIRDECVLPTPSAIDADCTTDGTVEYLSCGCRIDANGSPQMNTHSKCSLLNPAAINLIASATARAQPTCGCQSNPELPGDSSEVNHGDRRIRLNPIIIGNSHLRCGCRINSQGAAGLRELNFQNFRIGLPELTTPEIIDSLDPNFELGRMIFQDMREMPLPMRLNVPQEPINEVITID